MAFRENVRNGFSVLREHPQLILIPFIGRFMRGLVFVKLLFFLAVASALAFMIEPLAGLALFICLTPFTLFFDAVVQSFFDASLVGCILDVSHGRGFGWRRAWFWMAGRGRTLAAARLTVYGVLIVAFSLMALAVGLAYIASPALSASMLSLSIGLAAVSLFAIGFGLTPLPYIIVLGSVDAASSIRKSLGFVKSFPAMVFTYWAFGVLFHSLTGSLHTFITGPIGLFLRIFNMLAPAGGPLALLAVPGYLLYFGLVLVLASLTSSAVAVVYASWLTGMVGGEKGF